MKLSISAASVNLVWQIWDDVYIVYQPSSTETHVFNETTATVLRVLQIAHAKLEELHQRTVDSLGGDMDELDYDDLILVTHRLEELGLIEQLQ